MDSIEQPQQAQSTIRDRLALPVHSNTTSVLNGMGNGAMLAASPFAAFEVGSEIIKKPLTPEYKRGLMFVGFVATVVGSAIGAVSGLKEAHKVREYRKNVSEEIRKLRADVDAQAQGKAQQAR